MNRRIYLVALYFLLYALSGLNYKVFSLFLAGNPCLYIGIYSGLTALLLYSPVYAWAEGVLITRAPAAGLRVDMRQLKLAFVRYGWGLGLSVTCSAGWQVIT